MRWAGNAPYDAEAEWLHWPALGVDGLDGVDAALMRLMALAGLEADISASGCRAVST